MFVLWIVRIMTEIRDFASTVMAKYIHYTNLLLQSLYCGMIKTNTP